MKTLYPKDEIQLTVEETARQQVINDDNNNLYEFLDDQRDIIIRLGKLLEKQDSLDNGLNEHDYTTMLKLKEKFITGVFEESITLMNWVRDNNDDIIAFVISGNEVLLKGGKPCKLDH